MAACGKGIYYVPTSQGSTAHHISPSFPTTCYMLPFSVQPSFLSHGLCAGACRACPPCSQGPSWQPTGKLWPQPWCAEGAEEKGGDLYAYLGFKLCGADAGRPKLECYAALALAAALAALPCLYCRLQLCSVLHCTGLWLNSGLCPGCPGIKKK